MHGMTCLAKFSIILAAACTAACTSTQTAMEPPKEIPTPAASTTPSPPVAQQRPHVVRSPNGDRTDEYYWLRDDTRKDPAVLEHLRAEHAYMKAMLGHTEGLQQELYDEIVSRIKQDDSTVPYRKNGYWYYVRFVEGGEYPIHARKRGSLDAPEEVLLDGNEMAKGTSFFQIGNTEVTRDGKLLAYAVDTVGRRQWTLRVKDLASGKTLPDEIRNADSSIAWTAQGTAFLWIEKNPQTLLGFRVRKHVLGTDPASDPVVYEEKDESFYIDVFRGRSDRFVYINSRHTTTSEWRYADAADPSLAFKVISPRERGHEYDVEDIGDRFVIRTNLNALNFRLVTVPIADVAHRTKWRDVVAHRDDAFIHDFLTFRDFLAVEERSGALRKVRLKSWKDGKESLVAADEPSYAMSFGTNEEQDTPTLRYVYSSLTTPNTTYDLDTTTGERTLMKRDPVLGDFDPARYATELLWAPARDGQRIPISVYYRNDTARDGSAPLYVTGYGAYGFSRDPLFAASRLSLVDRGFVYALAHIRGGQEMGRAWYEEGRRLAKKNTFTDFIDVTEFLVARGYGAKDKVFAMGGSAGGLLMGAIANMRPDLYAGIVAHVPFVDVVTTMLDESIPLTTNEFDEWGNPKEKAYYEYMLSYSPYDHVKAQRYPAMLVTTGLWDSQVQYFEPAKWVARLRRLKQGDEPLLMYVNMEAGHGGKSGRFQRFREIALEYAFILDRLQ
jgi:oligopeptidase B